MPENPSVLVIPTEATIQTATQLMAELQKALGQSHPVALDLSGVDECDVTFIQLLLSIARSALASGQSITLLQDPPSVLAVALDRCGLPGLRGGASVTALLGA